MFWIRHTFLLLSLACVAPFAANGQRVYWDPPGGRLGLGKMEPVSLVFEDCSPAEAFKLPPISGLEFGSPSEAQQTSVINFQMTTRVVLTYPLRALEKGSITIPAFDALTNKGKLAVGEVRFDVGDAGVGSTGVAIGDIVSSQLKTSRPTLWVGEVVDVEYLLSASSRYNVSIASEPEWKPENLVMEPFGAGERVEVTVGTERRQAARYRTRGLFTQPGQVALAPVRQGVNVQTGERAVGFFSQPRVEQFTVESNAAPLTVKPLPQPAPGDFRGAVGSFKLESTIVPTSARIGEPITWTLTLSGSGNWTAGLGLPEREVSSDFQVVQPKTRTEMEKGRLFQGSMIEDAVLVPTVAGTYSLGPVTFTYFDPAAGQYRTQTVEAVTVKVDPVPAGYSATATQSPPPPGASEAATGLPGSTLAAPVPPLPGDLTSTPALPGDPLPVGASAATPRRLPLAWMAGVPLLVPLVCWLTLAIIQAVATDPARERRLALAELRRLLRSLIRTRSQPDVPTLESWRTLTARVWSIRRATPTVEDLATALATSRGAARPDDWLALWREAEVAMFAPGASLPDTWVTRAENVASSTRVRLGWAWWPGRRLHWAPRIAALACLFSLIAPETLDATEARDAYREGRFDEARDAWAAHLGRQPDDWAAHYNVALAAAQLDSWAEATAHATAANLLRPRAPEVRQQLRLAATHLNGIDPMLRNLLEPRAHDQAAYWLSPGEWQNLITGGVIVDGFALLALISSLYLRTNRSAMRAAGQAMLAVGSIAVIAGFLALSRYGGLADPQAAMVVQPVQLQSIPSDVAEKQKSVAISPGTIVIVERSFLGWDRVRTINQTGGWLRREAHVRFYLPPRSEPSP